MRKLVMLAAMLSLVAVVAVPAALAQGFSHDRFEQRFGHFFNDDFFKRFKDARFERQAVPAVEQSFEQKVGDTGDVDLSLGVLNTGNNSNQCTAPMQFCNTGNLPNQQGFVQSGSTAGNVSFSDSGFAVAPQQTVRCDQSVQQSAAASSSRW